MLEATRTLLVFVEGKNRASLDTDKLLVSGIIREFEVLGEAAGRISQEVQQQFEELPWKHVIGMRNRLIHVYFDVDHDILWQTIHERLPFLLSQLEKIFSEFVF
jgi:uncharacterized protein with HEPN domain